MRSIRVFFAVLIVFASGCIPLGVSTGTPASTFTRVTIATALPDAPATTIPTLTVTAAQSVTTLTFTPAAMTGTPAAGTTITPTELPYTACAWAWATQDLPALTTQLNQSYQDAGFPEVEAAASAYGENCLDAAQKVNHFAAMETDFNLIVPVTDTQDTQVLGNWIAKLVPVIGKIPQDQLSGPNPGRIAIRFKGSADEVNLSFLRTQAEDLLKQGLSGSALFDALHTP